MLNRVTTNRVHDYNCVHYEHLVHFNLFSLLQKYYCTSRGTYTRHFAFCLKMASEKLANLEIEQTKNGNKKFNQYLAAFIGKLSLKITIIMFK